jgi:hypothetical protein
MTTNGLLVDIPKNAPDRSTRRGALVRKAGKAMNQMGQLPAAR